MAHLARGGARTGPARAGRAGLHDIAALSDAVLVGIHLAALGVLTLAMRAGMHYVLLHEALDVTVGAPRVCANCSHLVPAWRSATMWRR